MTEARKRTEQRRQLVGAFLRDTNYSLSEIARRVGISREAVRQIQARYFPEFSRHGHANPNGGSSHLESREEMESRRLSAARDLQDGLMLADIARKYGVSPTTVSRWNYDMKQNGVEALRKRRPTGRPCRLTPDQLAMAVDIYQAGPMAAGFDSPRWTTARFADAIFEFLGVRYDPDHAGRILHRLGLRAKRKNS